MAEEAPSASGQLDEKEGIVTREYKIDNILSLIEQEHDCDRKTAKRMLIAWARGDEPSTDCRISRGWLTVTVARDEQHRIADMLADMNKYGVGHVEIHVWLAYGPADIIDVIVPEALMEGNFQARHQIIDRNEVREIINRLQNHPRTSLISRPTFRVMSGQTASAKVAMDPNRTLIMSGSVMATARPAEPAHRRVDGTIELPFVAREAAVEIQPVARADGKLWLRKCLLRLSKSNSELQRDGKTQLQATQLIATLLDASGVDLAAEEALVVAGVAASDEAGNDQRLVAVVQAYGVRQVTKERLDGNRATQRENIKQLPDDSEQSTNRTDAGSSSPSLPPPWEISLQEAIAVGLQNSKVVRSLGLVVMVTDEMTHNMLFTRLGETDEVAARTAVADLVSDIEHTYWDLWLVYRHVEQFQSARNAALCAWREPASAGTNRDRLPEEAIAREQVFFFQSQLEKSLREVFNHEARLRYLLGLASSGDELIFPTTAPAEGRNEFQWDESLAAALKHSAEIAEQRELISRLKVELAEASGAVAPRSRRELALLRYLELTTGCECADMEEIKTRLADRLEKALAEYNALYRLLQEHSKRAAASSTEVAALQSSYEKGELDLEILLDAYRRRTQSVLDRDRALIKMMMRLVSVHHLKGSLLDRHNIAIR